MSQKLRATTTPTRPVPEHLITGDRSTGDERLIGGDTGLAAVMARAQVVARSGAPVLLFGETGTGKEIIARAIHEDSAFRAGPFRRVNCGAIAPELIDSLPFDHFRHISQRPPTRTRPHRSCARRTAPESSLL